MAEEEVAQEGDEPAEGPLLYHNFVCSAEGETDIDYPIGILVVDGKPSVACIAVAEVDGLPLCAVPEEAWNRTKKKRKLPEDAFSRMVAVAVPACAEDRSVPEGEFSLKVWLGLLRTDYVGHVLYGPMLVPDIGFAIDSFGIQKLPYAESLVAVAKDHFTFLSLPEGHQGGEGQVGQRLKVVEDGLLQLQNTLEKLLERQPAAQPSPHTAYREQPARPKPRSQAAPPGLDPVVAKHALQAGVSERALAEVAALANTPAAQGQQRPVREQLEVSRLRRTKSWWLAKVVLKIP